MTAPDMPPAKWALLTSIWRGILVVAKILMGAFLGAWVFGLTSGIATIYCYMIGVYIGLPAGLIGGAILASRSSTASIFFTFGLGVSTWIFFYWTCQASDNWFVSEALGPLSGAIVTLAARFAAVKVPHPVKRMVGGTLCSLLAILGAVWYLERIYR